MAGRNKPTIKETTNPDILKCSIMAGRNMNVYFQDDTYSKIKNLVTKREISRFINEAVEEKLAKKQQQQKEQLRQQLITDYKNQAKNEKLRKMLRVYGEMSWEDINTELIRWERKNNE